MTDKPDAIHPPSVPEDNRGIQPGLILTGIFGAIIGMGAVIIAAKAGSKSKPAERTPDGP